MTDTVDFVLQLLDAALKAREYIQDFRNAPNDRRKLASEMEDLQRQLRARITADPSNRIVQQMDTSLTALKCTMEELTLDLSPGKGQIARFTKQLTWSLWNKKEVGGYLVELERFKVLLNSWLMLDIWFVLLFSKWDTGSVLSLILSGRGDTVLAHQRQSLNTPIGWTRLQHRLWRLMRPGHRSPQALF
jgi:hypothetical protein